LKRFKQRIKKHGQIKFYLTWTIVLPLSALLSLWFANITFTPFTLSYRSLTIVNTVIFGYAGIASFLIPLALAAKLAPKKAEGMTYAYFMALSNVSAGFLPSITGAQMFRILKKMLHQPETIIQSLPMDSLLIVLAGMALAALMIYIIFKLRKLYKSRSPRLGLAVTFVGFALAITLFVACYFAPTVLANLKQLKTVPIYIVQQSYIGLQPLIGNADFLGKDAYRALILRYALIIGAIFTLIAIPFVYLLKIPKEKQEL